MHTIPTDAKIGDRQVDDKDGMFHFEASQQRSIGDQPTNLALRSVLQL
jgi:hypothetical protein